jgi:hypothetical protein
MGTGRHRARTELPLMRVLRPLVDCGVGVA